MAADAKIEEQRTRGLVEFFRAVGWRTEYLARFFGGTALLAVNTFQVALKPPFPWRETGRQMYLVGVKSFTIVAITSIFVGMVLALQFAYGFSRFGASLFVPKLVALTLFREMGPVLTALLVGGKVGAGMAAELGSMSVTEQIDAVRALGANPVKKLVVPRVIAMTIMMPLLAVYADFIGLFGGLVVCMSDVGMGPRYFWTSVVEVSKVGDVMHGVSKCVFFGFAVGLIGCYQGIRTTGGTEGVGSATTTTVVMVSITVLISDFFLSKLFWIL
jgi:phospholipid/cholesterol/gamma-HCH transport system permease protein